MQIIPFHSWCHFENTVPGCSVTSLSKILVFVVVFKIIDSHIPTLSHTQSPHTASKAIQSWHEKEFQIQFKWRLCLCSWATFVHPITSLQLGIERSAGNEFSVRSPLFYRPSRTWHSAAISLPKSANEWNYILIFGFNSRRAIKAWQY